MKFSTYRKPDFAVLFEIKQKRSGTMESGSYIAIYSGVPKIERTLAEIMLYMHGKHRENMDSNNVHYERVISARIHSTEDFLTVIGIYAPVEGEEERSK